MYSYGVRGLPRCSRLTSAHVRRVRRARGSAVDARRTACGATRRVGRVRSGRGRPNGRNCTSARTDPSAAADAADRRRVGSPPAAGTARSIVRSSLVGAGSRSSPDAPRTAAPAFGSRRRRPRPCRSRRARSSVRRAPAPRRRPRPTVRVASRTSMIVPGAITSRVRIRRIVTSIVSRQAGLVAPVLAAGRAPGSSPPRRGGRRRPTPVAVEVVEVRGLPVRAARRTRRA